MPEEKFPLPTADIAVVGPKYWRQRVPDPTGGKPGSVVVHTADRMLYHVHDDGMAIHLADNVRDSSPILVM